MKKALQFLLSRKGDRSEKEYSHLADEQDIYYCFRLLLGRPPDRVELQGHLSQTGLDLNSVVSQYLNSFEFSRRLADLSKREVDDRVFLKEMETFSLYVQEGDSAVGKHIKHLGAYEPHVTSVFSRELKPGMNVIDIGANIGYFTMLAAKLVGPNGSVMAIEPNPINVKLMEASRRTNSLDNVTIVQAAAGRGLGLLMLNTSFSNGTTAGLSADLVSLLDATTVPCLVIDDLVPADRHVDFVKIDVEGAEYNALFGAQKTIRRCKPTIVSEFGPAGMPGISGVTGPEYLQFLLGFGYDISVIEKDGSLVDCGNDVEKVMNAFFDSGVDHIDIVFTPANKSTSRATPA